MNFRDIGKSLDVIREYDLKDALQRLSSEVGISAPGITGNFNVTEPFALSEIATPEIEEAAAAAYRRDYVMFGFGKCGWA